MIVVDEEQFTKMCCCGGSIIFFLPNDEVNERCIRTVITSLSFISSCYLLHTPGIHKRQLCCNGEVAQYDQSTYKARQKETHYGGRTRDLRIIPHTKMVEVRCLTTGPSGRRVKDQSCHIYNVSNGSLPLRYGKTCFRRLLTFGRHHHT